MKTTFVLGGQYLPSFKTNEFPILNTMTYERVAAQLAMALLPPE
jgi:hypothetical protein